MRRFRIVISETNNRLLTNNFQQHQRLSVFARPFAKGQCSGWISNLHRRQNSNDMHADAHAYAIARTARTVPLPLFALTVPAILSTLERTFSVLHGSLCAPSKALQSCRKVEWLPLLDRYSANLTFDSSIRDGFLHVMGWRVVRTRKV